MQTAVEILRFWVLIVDDKLCNYINLPQYNINGVDNLTLCVYRVNQQAAINRMAQGEAITR